MHACRGLPEGALNYCKLPRGAKLSKKQLRISAPSFRNPFSLCLADDPCAVGGTEG